MRIHFLAFWSIGRGKHRECCLWPRSGQNTEQSHGIRRARCVRLPGRCARHFWTRLVFVYWSRGGPVIPPEGHPATARNLPTPQMSVFCLEGHASPDPTRVQLLLSEIPGTMWRAAARCQYCLLSTCIPTALSYGYATFAPPSSPTTDTLPRRRCTAPLSTTSATSLPTPSCAVVHRETRLAASLASLLAPLHVAWVVTTRGQPRTTSGLTHEHYSSRVTKYLISHST